MLYLAQNVLGMEYGSNAIADWGMRIADNLMAPQRAQSKPILK